MPDGPAAGTAVDRPAADARPWHGEPPPVDAPAAAGPRPGPARGLGAGFARLWAAAAISNVGAGQTLVDTAQHAVVPALVSRDPGQLERANGRLQGTQIVANQFIGPPAGGFLFSLAAWIPLVVDAVSFGASSALVAVVNLVAVACDAILVLFAQERLGLGSVGFGLLLTGSAAGGLLGSLVAPWLSRRLGAAAILLGGVVARGFGLRAPFLVAGVVVPLVAALCLPAVSRRSIAEARARAGA